LIKIPIRTRTFREHVANIVRTFVDCLHAVRANRWCNTLRTAPLPRRPHALLTLCSSLVFFLFRRVPGEIVVNLVADAVDDIPKRRGPLPIRCCELGDIYRFEVAEP